MKILDSILSLLKLAIGGICVFVTGFLCGVNPKNELKYRKRCSKFLTSMIAKDIIIEGKRDPNAQLLLGNHTSNLDIPVMETVFDDEKLIWVTKKELSQIPIVKYLITKSDMIIIDRSDKRSVLKMLKEIKKHTKNNTKVVLFPEGTRNKGDYTKLLNFKNGPKGIVEKQNLKVQPFLIINLPNVFKKNPFRIKKQKIKIVFLESFYPYDDWYKNMRNNMQKILDKEYNINGE
jgi:1-acyl-sn-glycerol-3-phosphate acyltransferase